MNTYYAVLRDREYYPDIMYVFTAEEYRPELQKTLGAIRILNEEFNIAPQVKSEIVNTDKFYDATKAIFEIIKNFKNNGYQVAIDITPGRKALVVATVIPATKIGVD
ncbi:MAG: hypothetical protein KAJ51_00650, partial [Thermoplasmata archaeon]|nr:hypothetical protein [Thermoplasmata archaeon]